MVLDLTRVLPAEDPDGHSPEISRWLGEKLDLLVRRAKTAVILLVQTDNQAMRRLKTDLLEAMRSEDGDAQIDCQDRLVALAPRIHVDTQLPRTGAEIRTAREVFLFLYGSCLAHEQLTRTAQQDGPEFQDSIDLIKRTITETKRAERNGMLASAMRRRGNIINELRLRYATTTRSGFIDSRNTLRAFAREYAAE